MSDSLLRAATIEVASSGKDVPTATMVSQITVWLIPSALAISTAPSTIRFPHNANQTIPPNIQIIEVDILTFFISSILFSSTTSFSLAIEKI